MGVSVAWMLRQDGQSFEIPIHPYGDPEDPEYMIMNAEWLYNHTNNKKTRQDILNLLASYAVENDCVDITTFIEVLLDNDYLNVSIKFINSVYDDLEKTIENVLLNEKNGNVDSSVFNHIVMDDLNQEFCRVRAGGAYDSDGSLGDLYFRTSSKGFNWFNIIWEFVYNLYKQHKVETVTITRDKESTKEEVVYYNRIPVEEFITLKGRPYIENMNRRN